MKIIYIYNAKKRSLGPIYLEENISWFPPCPSINTQLHVKFWARVNWNNFYCRDRRRVTSRSRRGPARDRLAAVCTSELLVFFYIFYCRHIIEDGRFSVFCSSLQVLVEICPMWTQFAGSLTPLLLILLGVSLPVDSIRLESHSLLTQFAWSLTPCWLSLCGVSQPVDSIDIMFHSLLTQFAWSLTPPVDSVCVESHPLLTQFAWSLTPLWLSWCWVSLPADLVCVESHSRLT